MAQDIPKFEAVITTFQSEISSEGADKALKALAKAIADTRSVGRIARGYIAAIFILKGLKQHSAGVDQADREEQSRAIGAIQKETDYLKSTNALGVFQDDIHPVLLSMAKAILPRPAAPAQAAPEPDAAS